MGFQRYENQKSIFKQLNSQSKMQNEKLFNENVLFRTEDKH